MRRKLVYCYHHLLLMKEQCHHLYLKSGSVECKVNSRPFIFNRHIQNSTNLLSTDFQSVHCNVICHFCLYYKNTYGFQPQTHNFLSNSGYPNVEGVHRVFRTMCELFTKIKGNEAKINKLMALSALMISSVVSQDVTVHAPRAYDIS